MVKSDKVKKMLIPLVVIIAILIIGLLMFFSEEGIYSTGPPNYIPSCTAPSGYLCENPQLSTSGILSLTFGQNSGITLYNIQMACTSTLNNINARAWTAEFSSLPTGLVAPMNNLICYGQSSLPISNSSNPMTIGQSFNGYILLNYTNSAGAPNGRQNPWHAITIPITIKATG